MSLAILLKGREGIVMGADSRITFGESPPVYYDNATKLLQIDGLSHIGVLTYGASFIDVHNRRTVHSYLPEIEYEFRQHGEGWHPTVQEAATFLSQFLVNEHQNHLLLLLHLQNS